MEMYFALGPFIALLILYLLLRFRPAVVFLGLCFGVVLAGTIDADGLSTAVAPITGPTSPSTVSLVALVFPMIIMMLLTLRQGHSLSLRALPQIVVLIGVAVLLLMNGLVYLDAGTAASIRSGAIWQFFDSYDTVIIAVTGLMSLLQVFKHHKPLLAHHEGKHHI